MFSSQTREIKNVHIIKTTAPITTKILHSDKDHQMPLVGGPDTRITNADGRHLGKIEKSSYLSHRLTDFGEIWHAHAVRPS